MKSENKREVLSVPIQSERSNKEEVEQLRSALLEGEKSGVCELTPSQIMKRVLLRKKR